MKEIYSMKIRETLEGSLMKYIQLNEIKVQKMIGAQYKKMEKVLQFIGHCNIASYINQLLPNLIINKKETLFLGAKQNFIKHIKNEIY